MFIYDIARGGGGFLFLCAILVHLYRKTDMDIFFFARASCHLGRIIKNGRSFFGHVSFSRAEKEEMESSKSSDELMGWMGLWNPTKGYTRKNEE